MESAIQNCYIGYRQQGSAHGFNLAIVRLVGRIAGFSGTPLWVSGLIAVPSSVMRLASHGGMWPPWSGRFAVPERFTSFCLS